MTTSSGRPVGGALKAQLPGGAYLFGACVTA